MDDNFNNSSMAGKVVSILIALLFIVVLAFPIANSLGNTNNGGGGESEKIVLNTLSDEYGADLSPYKSWEVYVKDTTPTLPSTITITLEDLQNHLDVCSSIDWGNAMDDSNNAFWLFASTGENAGHSDNIQIGYIPYENILVVTVNSSNYEFENISAFSLTVSTDYTLTYAFTSSGSDKEGTFQATYVKSISDSEYGFVESTGEISERFTVGSQLVLWPSADNDYDRVISITEDMISDDTLSFSVVVGGYTFEYTLDIQSTDTEGVWQFTDSLWDYEGTTVYDQNNNLVENAYCYVDSITTYGYTESESGSDSGSGIDGVASTLIKLVPVLMIIGLLMIFVIPMVHKPN